MKNIFVTLIIFFAIIYCSQSNAQSWKWCKGTSGGQVDGYGIALDTSGNVFVTGEHAGYASVFIPVEFDNTTVPCSPSAAYQLLYAKYDNNGQELWAKGTQYGNALPMGIASDVTGNVLIFGVFSDSVLIGATKLYTSAGNSFIAKVDKNGNTIWAKKTGKNGSTYSGIMFIEPGTNHLIGSAGLSGGAIATDKNENVYITSIFRDSTTIAGITLHNHDVTGSTYDAYVAKFDKNGNIVWAKTFGGVKNEEVYTIAVISDTVYIAGSFFSPTIAHGASSITNGGDLRNAYIASFTVDGAPNWCKQFTGQNFYDSYISGIAGDPDGDIYFTGSFADTFLYYDGSKIAKDKIAAAALFLIKIDGKSKKLVWDKTIGFVEASAIATSACGSVWVTGAGGNTTVDGHLTPAPPNSYDVSIIAGYTFNGKYINSTCLQSGGDDIMPIACASDGSVYVNGDYELYDHPFIIGSDTLRGNEPFNGEVLFTAKYDFDNTDTLKVTRDSVICTGEVITLSAGGDYESYLWDNGDISKTRSASSIGSYWVIGTQVCKQPPVLETINMQCSCTVAFPNAFTPNKDGLNDFFLPTDVLKCPLSGYKLSIFNRWGNLVFETNDINKGWDGTYHGIKQGEGVYAYQLSYFHQEIGGSIQKEVKGGNVTLLR